MKDLPIPLYKAMDGWMNAATVIITTPKVIGSLTQKIKNCNFDVMMIKRSAKSPAFPNTYAFPGGKVDKSDCSSQWLSLYNSIDVSFVKYMEKLKVKQYDNNRSPILLPQADDILLRELSLRICAIREAFEETGILITRMKTDNLEQDYIRYAQLYNFQDIAEHSMWRKRVVKDVNQFLEMCCQLKCVPDVWGLHEWSNWLTPSQNISKSAKRFDTVFFKVALSEFPSYIEHDAKEISHVIHSAAEDLLADYYSKKILLIPPQVYELSRIKRFSSHVDLADFAARRGLLGMERWLPIPGVTEDGVLASLYPGDCYYPTKAVKKGETEKVSIPSTYEEWINNNSNHLNHTKIEREKGCFVRASYQPLYGHVLPVGYNKEEKPNSKL